MKVLVTGGTGVVGEGAIAALLRHGHEVRILSRFGDRGVRRWPTGVEARAGDVASAAEVNGSARGCDAIVHIAGIEEENPPDLTFEKVNVLGTRHVVAEAERARVRRLVFLSSLGADTGTSEYHKSKQRAEQSVRGCARPWVILRPGGVYGPNDRNLSLILRMVRTLPAIPVIDGGNQRFQPVWYEDVGEAIARAVDKPDITGEVLDLAGPDRTTMNDLLDRLETVSGRHPRRVPVPAAMASMGVQLAGLLGFKLPVSEARLTMLREENIIEDGRENALTSILRVEPTSLDAGLKKLVGDQPEQLPSEGVGPLVHKRYWADIDASYHRAPALRDVFRRNVARAMPFEVRQDKGPVANLKKNDTFTVNLPLRGALAMRVEEITPDRIVCSTLQGHPLAGLLAFNFIERGRQVRFEVGVYARGADIADTAIMAAIGEFLQDINWMATVERVVKLSGGRAPEGPQMLVTTLDDEEAEKVEKWAEDLMVRRLRGRVPPGPPIDGRRRAVRTPPARPRSRRPKAAAPKKSTRSARKRPATSARKRPRAAAARGTRAAASKGTARPRRAPAKAPRRK